jgi:hypothetical protein
MSSAETPTKTAVKERNPPPRPKHVVTAAAPKAVQAPQCSRPAPSAASWSTAARTIGGPTAHEVFRTEELAEQRRARSVDHAGLEVEEHRAWYVLAARGLVVKHNDTVELQVVVAAVPAVAADAMLVAQHLLKIGAYLVTALARLHVQNLARSSSLEAGSTWKKNGGEERRNVRNFVSQFSTGNRKYRWRAHARWVWAGAVAKCLLRPCARCSSPRLAPRRCRNRRRTTRQMCSGKE